MADVFISCSRLDLERVKPIADRLTSLGYSVWWDKQPREAMTYAEEAERELETARAVLTVWTHSARDSTWMFAELSYALDAQKFLQLKLDTVQPPMPFDAMPIADMSGDRGEWGPLEAALTRIVRDSVQPEPERPLPKIGLFATAAASGSPKVLTLALAAILAAFAGGMTATFNGMMSAEQLQIALVGMVGVAGACAALAAHRIVTIARAGS